MNEAILKGKWNQLKGSVKNNWRELTDEDLDSDEGDAKMLSMIIQERYGITKEEADQQVREFGRI